MDRQKLIELIEKTIKPSKDFDYDQYDTEYLHIWYQLVNEDIRSGYTGLIGQPINMEIPAIKFAKTQVNVTYKRKADDEQDQPNKKSKNNSNNTFF